MKIRFKIPYTYFKWSWHWHQIFDVLSDLTPQVPALSMAICMHDELGDSLVEKTSAHALNVVGKIRRAEFELQHFELKTNPQKMTSYEGPNNQQVTVNPWMLLFVELGLPIAAVSHCWRSVEGQEPKACADFDMGQAV